MAYKTKIIDYKPPRKDANTEQIEVKLIPDSKGRLVFDHDRDFYYYHVKDGIWIKVKHGLYRLKRVFSSMLLTYSYLELPLIEKIEKECDNVHVEYLRTDKDNRPYLGTVLSKLQLAIGRVRDEDKVAGKKQIIFCRQLSSLESDKETDDIVVGVLRAHTMKAIARFQKRLATIHRIQPRVLFLYTRIERMIEQIEQLNHRSLHYLEQVLEHSQSLQTGEVSAQGHKPLIKEYLRKTAESIHQTNIKPFTRTREKLLQEIREAKEYMSANNWQALNKVTLIMINSLKLKSLRGPLENIMIDLSLGIRRRELFSASRQSKVYDLISKITTQDLIEIDESGFEIPVADRVAGYLEKARLLLKQPEPNREDLKETKKYIDEAIGLI
ncbi:MAG: hypothetical protein GF349_03310 [Candidatus Magasanikbacteria bacterium]|nr:hypothetical protein [Candidatus Magasanikbacteria bacterium]